MCEAEGVLGLDERSIVSHEETLAILVRHNGEGYSRSAGVAPLEGELLGRRVDVPDQGLGRCLVRTDDRALSSRHGQEGSKSTVMMMLSAR